jgi:DNA-binding transcriptional LysR family regulator
MLRFDDLQLFVRTAEAGSLSAAARVLEISPAVASAALKRLETQLDVRLFARSTRSLRLTTQGQLFLEDARLALQNLEDGRQLLAGSKAGISGPLQLSAPSDFGRNTLLLGAACGQAQRDGPALVVEAVYIAPVDRPAGRDAAE